MVTQSLLPRSPAGPPILTPASVPSLQSATPTFHSLSKVSVGKQRTAIASRGIRKLTKVQPRTVSTTRARTNYEYTCGAGLSCSWCSCCVAAELVQTFPVSLTSAAAAEPAANCVHPTVPHVRPALMGMRHANKGGASWLCACI